MRMLDPMRWWVGRSLILVAVLSLMPGWLVAASTLNFPRLSFQEATFTALAVVNPNSQDAEITATAYGVDGQILALPTNPAQLMVPANQQLALLAADLFGGTLEGDPVAWFQVTSPLDGLTGFFLFLNGTATFLDGADLPILGRELVFPQVLLEEGSGTELNLINPGNGPANVELQLIRAGMDPLSRELVIASKGVARVDIVTLFEIVPDGSSGYVKVSSDVELGAMAFVSYPDADLVGMGARSAAEALTHLYIPQVVVGAGTETSAGVVNNSDQAVILTFSFFKPDGTKYVEEVQQNDVTRALNPGSLVIEDLATLFGISNEQLIDGWLLVVSSSPAVTGFVTYGTPATGARASVAPARVGLTRAIFSHVETTVGFFTGLAILNPGQLAANVRIAVISKEGQLKGTTSLVLQPGQRISELLTGLVEAAQGQSAGLIFLESTVPVYSTSLFGTNSLKVIANIPPQAAPADYDPVMEDPLRVTPGLAVVQPNSMQSFQLEGSQNVPIWRVNGEEAGNPQIGTIAADGTYTAPSEVPSPPLVTVSAQVGTQSAASSVDVLAKETLLTSQSVVQSVAFLGSLQRLYTAELQVLGAAQAPAAAPGQAGTDSEIFEVAGPGLPKVSVAQLAGESVSKMIPFTASNGSEFLLLAAKTSGKVIRLDPRTRATSEVVVNLNEPESLVIDPTTGDLLVAEQDQVTTVPRAELEEGLVPAARADGGTGGSYQLELFPIQGADGIEVDRCTGNVYISNQSTGEILEFIQETEEVRTFVSGLQEPTRLLALYREGVSCPDGFQLLLIEQGSDQIQIVLNRGASVRRWIDARQSRDLTFLPGNSLFADSTEAVLFTESVDPEVGESVAAVSVPDLYKQAPANEPTPLQLPTSATVQLLVSVAQQISMTCNDPQSSTWQEDASLDIHITGSLPLDGSLRITGTWSWDAAETRSGTGLFADVGSDVEMLGGTVEIQIAPDEPPTSSIDVSGTWQVTLSAEGLPDDISSVVVTQQGNTLSAVTPNDDFEKDIEGDTGCSVSCSGPGVCTAQCPESVTCNLSCDPATPSGCALDFPAMGTISVDP